MGSKGKNTPVGGKRSARRERARSTQKGSSRDLNQEPSRSALKYHGLKNQGATCYLNSVLQVLFMTKDFREAVLSSTNRDQKCIDGHLSILFKTLQTGQAQTQLITKHLDIRRVTEQDDAAACFERILRQSSPQASQIFQGELTHKNTCSQCGTHTEDSVAFWSLPLPLVDSGRDAYCVMDGIESFFQESHISGDNQMFCDLCKVKADATIKAKMKHHPEVLTLLLKRFKFDFSHMDYVKIRCAVKIPTILQIPCDEGQSQTYELYAFVEHYGELKHGHYTVTIKPQGEENWYNFNDTAVTKVNNNKGSQSAYLLYYRKRKMPPVSAEDTQNTTNVSTSETSKQEGREKCEQHEEKVKNRERQDDEATAAAAAAARNESNVQGQTIDKSNKASNRNLTDKDTTADSVSDASLSHEHAKCRRQSKNRPNSTITDQDDGRFHTQNDSKLSPNKNSRKWHRKNKNRSKEDKKTVNDGGDSRGVVENQQSQPNLDQECKKDVRDTVSHNPPGCSSEKQKGEERGGKRGKSESHCGESKVDQDKGLFADISQTRIQAESNGTGHKDVGCQRQIREEGKEHLNMCCENKGNDFYQQKSSGRKSTQDDSEVSTSEASKLKNSEQLQGPVKTRGSKEDEGRAARNQDNVGRKREDKKRAATVRRDKDAESSEEKLRNEEKMKRDQYRTLSGCEDSHRATRKTSLSNDQSQSNGDENDSKQNTSVNNPPYEQAVSNSTEKEVDQNSEKVSLNTPEGELSQEMSREVTEETAEDEKAEAECDPKSNDVDSLVVCLGKFSLKDSAEAQEGSKEKNMAGKVENSAETQSLSESSDGKKEEVAPDTQIKAESDQSSNNKARKKKGQNKRKEKVVVCFGSP
ncbi:uncharacterized protein [Leuresthes tenuis]|uniref:uncharacterized protein n=1 Tax=Leuresthes tenuis TaxID=355514 RepID=UPI003B501727